MDYQSNIRLSNGRAEIQIGDISFAVTRRDTDSRHYMCPVEMVIGALGSWIALTMSAVADHKKIKIDKAHIQIAHRIWEGKPWVTSFAIKIDLGNNLTHREQKILFNSARSCEVHKMLAGEFTFDYQLVWKVFSNQLYWGAGEFFAQQPGNRGMNYRQRNRALSEWIRDR